MLQIKSSLVKLSGYDYSSTQINLPEDIAKEIIDWGKEQIPDDNIYTEPDKNYGREDEIHCTIKYGLHTTDANEVKSKVKDFGSFRITLGEISRFTPHDKPYDVVKVAVESQRLHDLNKILSELPNSDEHPIYTPHITIAYIKSGTHRDLSGKQPFVKLNINVKEIVFSPKDDGDKIIVTL